MISEYIVKYIGVKLKYNITIMGKIKKALSINTKKNQLSPFFSIKYVSQSSHFSFIFNQLTNIDPLPQDGHKPEPAVYI